MRGWLKLSSNTGEIETSTQPVCKTVSPLKNTLLIVIIPFALELMAAVQASLRSKAASLHEDNWMYEADDAY